MKIVENFLSPSIIDAIVKNNKELVGSPVWFSNLAWEPGLQRSSGTVLARKLSPELHLMIQKRLQQTKILSPQKKVKISAMAYLWQPLSYIPWHDDNGAAGGATIYLNKEWDPNWGGYLLWRKGKEVKCLEPKFNRLVVNTKLIEHSTTLTTAEAPLRQTIQIFWHY